MAILTPAALALGHAAVVGQPQTGAAPNASSRVPSVEQLPECVPAYGQVEVRIAISSTYANPFNPDQVELDLEITNPGGQRITVPAFWCQDYQRVPRGREGRQQDRRLDLPSRHGRCRASEDDGLEVPVSGVRQQTF